MALPKQKRNLQIGATFVALVALLVLGQAALQETAAAQAKGAVQAPIFEVDPFWPKPLPNHWLLGMTIGVGVDSRDHVWIVHRGAATLNARTEAGADANPPIGECCLAAPPVLEFDPAGNLVGHWGGPGQGYDWPESNHGITPDDKGNLWIGGNGQPDSHILKFTRDGKFVAQFGKAAARKTASEKPEFVGGSNDQQSFGRVAKVFVDPKANEVYVADGYLNKRVAVIDADTGAFKRFWGAYGNKPDDSVFENASVTGDQSATGYDPKAPPAQQFRHALHCVAVSKDGFVYACDRQNNRVQVFTKEGKFLKEAYILKETRNAGAVWDIAFSADPQQTYMYVGDGENELIHVLRRETLEELTAFGDGGRQPGQFYGVHVIATDSKGNLYTAETYEGRRVQRFLFKGVKPVTRKYQGVVWPGSAK
jgi:DNA-binding beta-propeller fold protein YncE